MKEGWEVKKLGEVCEVINGYAFKSDRYADKGTRIIRITNVQKGFVVDDDPKYYSDEDMIGLNQYLLYENDLLMSLTGNVGRVGLLENKMLPAALNQRVACLRIKAVNVSLRYLFHYLNSSIFEQEAIISASGIAQKNMSTEWLKKHPIPLPPLPEQEKIVAELDCLSGIIEKKKQQLKELDALAQSIFYEMFGDPVENEKGWEVKKLKDITTKIGSGATPKGGNQSYKKSGISLVRSLNIHNNVFVYKDLAFIDETQAANLSNVILQENDVLLNITGASVARCCIVPSNVLPARVNQHVAIIRSNSDVSHVFLCYQFTSDIYQQKLLSIGKSNGATREALTKLQLESLSIILPPISLQHSFASKVEAIEKQKELIKQSIAETELLFNSRMQYYFG